MSQKSSVVLNKRVDIGISMCSRRQGAIYQAPLTLKAMQEAETTITHTVTLTAQPSSIYSKG